MSRFFAFSSFAFCLALAACDDRPHLAAGSDLTVRLVSDFVAGHEASRVLVDLHDGALDTATLRAAQFERPLEASESLALGVVAARVPGLPDGVGSVRVSLTNTAGVLLGSRRVEFEMRGSTTVTVHITRDCQGVVCPANADSCVAGACVDARCSGEKPEYCGAATLCETDSECGGASSCSTARCVDRVCVSVPIGGQCAASEYCDASEGTCAPIVPTEMPGGPDPRCGRVCRVDGDACRYGYYDCQVVGEVICRPFVSRPIGAPCGEGLACDESATCVATSPPDAGVDAAIDATTDMAIDATIDAAVDAAADMGMGMGMDATIDAAIDASADLGADSASVDPPQCEDGVTATSAADLEPYYPCRHLHRLVVTGAADLTTLSMPNLETVATVVDIAENAALEGVSLPNLRSVGGTLFVRKNPLLSTIDLSAVSAYGDQFRIYANASYECPLDGEVDWTTTPGVLVACNERLVALSLDGLVDTREDDPSLFAIVANDVMETFEAPNLVHTGHVFVAFVTTLTSFTVPKLETALGMVFNSIPALPVIELPELRVVSGRFDLYGRVDDSTTGVDNDQSIVEVLELPRLETVGESFDVRHNRYVHTVNAPVLATAEQVVIYDNHVLATVSMPALANVKQVIVDGNGVQGWGTPDYDCKFYDTLGAFPWNTDEQFAVFCNPVLTSLDFSALPGVNGSFLVAFNESLPTLALPSLGSVAGVSIVALNESLASVTLPALTRADGMIFAIISNPSLVGVTMTNLEHTEGVFALGENDALTLISLPSLTTVVGSFGLETNASVTGVELPSLAYVGDHFIVSEMPLVTELDFPELASAGSTPFAAFPGDNTFGIHRMATLRYAYFPKLVTMGMELDVYNNPELSALDLSGVVGLTNPRSMYDMPLLDTLLLSSVTSFTGNWTVSGLAHLQTFDLSSLMVIEPGNSLTISGNNELCDNPAPSFSMGPYSFTPGFLCP